MSDVAPQPAPARETFGQTLSDRVAGIPVWAFVIVGGLLLLFYFSRKKASSTSQTSQTGQQTTPAASTTQGGTSQVGTSQVPVLVTGTPVIPTSNINAQPQNVPLTTSDLQSPTVNSANNVTSPGLGSAQQAPAGSLTPGNESGQPAAGTATQTTTPATG